MIVNFLSERKNKKSDQILIKNKSKKNCPSVNKDTHWVFCEA